MIDWPQLNIRKYPYRLFGKIVVDKYDQLLNDFSFINSSLVFGVEQQIYFTGDRS